MTKTAEELIRHFVRKQTDVEAIQFQWGNIREIIDFVGDSMMTEQREGVGVTGYFITDYTGKTRLLCKGDWIVKEDGKFLKYDQYEFKKRFVAGATRQADTEGKERIPITPEILEKAGFLPLPNNFEGRKTGLPVNSNTAITAYVSGLLGISTVVNESGEEIQITHVTYPHIKYVHQLQNLYHALTGAELFPTPQSDKPEADTEPAALQSLSGEPKEGKDKGFMQGYAAALSALYQFEGCASTVVMEVFRCNKIRIADFDKYEIDQMDRKFLIEINKMQ